MLFPEMYPEKNIYVPEHFPHLELTQEHLDVFYDKVREHISYVQEAGVRLGLTRGQLELHDLSKFSPREFGAYAKHFHGGGAPQEFAAAWLHHIHANAHHWQHWIFADGYDLKGANLEDGVMEMPSYYAMEMVADWMGASRAYAGSFDMADWLQKHVPRILLHSNTALFVENILLLLGYKDIGKAYRFNTRERQGEMSYGT